MTSIPPSTSLKRLGSSSGSSRVPIGMPTMLPSTKGHSRETCQPRRTRMAEMIWPGEPPNTAITAASWGSTPQTQMAIATIANAKPEMPWTSPATAAPKANTHNSLIAVPSSTGRP